MTIATWRRAAACLAFACGLAAPAAADQSSIVTPTTGPHSMTDFTTNFLNPALRALLSCSSGAVAPANGPSGAPMQGQCWLDTSAAPLTLRVYDGAQWPAFANVDASGHIISLPNAVLTGTVKIPALTGYLYSPGTGALTAATTIPAAALSGFVPAANVPALTGDVTTPGGSLATTLATVNASPGSYGGASSVPVVTVDGKGRVTGVATQTVVAPAGTLTGAALAASVVNSSLQTLGAGAAYNNLAANSVDPPKMSQAPAGTLRGNLTGSTANVADSALTAHMDAAFGTTRGAILYRGASGWVVAAPGAGGTVWTSAGPGSDPGYASASALAATPRGYLAGLTLANNASNPNTQLDVASGVATADDNTIPINLASTLTKTLGSWAVGGGNGGLDTGSAAANTWYHVFLIQRTDTNVVDVLFSTSATAPTLPASYTKKRRIGSIKTTTTASNITAFTQKGDIFRFAVPVQVYGSSPNTTSGIVVALSAGVPAGIATEAIIMTRAFDGSATYTQGYVSSVSQADLPVSDTVFTHQVSVSGTYSIFVMNVGVDVYQQIRLRSNSATFYWVIVSLGWVDTRGK